jgi:hypothetical protein
MAGILHSLFAWYLKRRKQQIDHFKSHPITTQQKVFEQLLEHGAKTRFGQEHAFDHITSRSEFARRVPMQDYNSLKPYIERTIAGEENELWPGRIKWFAKSSGTTQDKSKFIPMPPEALEDCHFRAGKDMYALYFEAYPENKLLEGKSLVLGGSHEVSELNQHSRQGDLSAVLMSNLPFWAQLMRTPKLSTALLDDWEEKMYRMAETTRKENVTSLLGVPTWTVVLIREVLRRSGKDSIHEVWPDLELYVHGGVSFQPYRALFRELIPSDGMHYLETYNASEGFFGIQDDLTTRDMLLMLDYGIYYEFVPMDALQDEQPEALPLEAVEVDTPYAMLISNKNGLWRYLLGDLVRFTSLDPYKIQVAGRTRHFINAFGEEVIVENAEEALAAACRATGAEVHDFTAAPVFFSQEGNGAHEWIVEFARYPSSLEAFTQALDRKLQAINSDYEAKRAKGIALRSPIVRSVEPDTFYKWMKSRGKLGGQNKVPRLYNDRTFVDSVWAFATKLGDTLEQVNR